MRRIADCLVSLAVSLLLVACIPTSARKNAKLEPGFDLELIAGGQSLAEGTDRAGNPTEATGAAHFEADAQWAWLFEDGGGFAAQLKVPWSIVYSQLDFYYQLPPLSEKFYVGVGAELGGFHGVYAAASYYLSPGMYLTATPRLLRISGVDDEDGSQRRPHSYQFGGQLALGFTGTVDLSAFAMIAHQTGEGFDIEVDLFGDYDEDYRKDYALIGVAVRF